MRNSIVSGMLAVLPSNIAALPPYNQPVAAVDWTQDAAISGVKMGQFAYLHSIKEGAGEYFIHGTIPGRGWDHECLVLHSASNSVEGRTGTIFGADFTQKPSFQREYVSLVKAVVTQPSDTIVADAVEFSKAIKSVEWQPSVWSDEGEIVFEWIDESKHAVVSVEGDGSIGYTMLIDGRFISGAIEEANVHMLPADLRDYLLQA